VTDAAARGTGRPKRPVRPALTREYIVATALALIDRDGLKALSMRRLGAELGTDPMAVYHHLPSKSALFDGVVEAVYQEIDLSQLPADRTWRDQIEWFMRRLRAVLRKHPNALPVIGTRPATTPSMLRILDDSLGALIGGGLAASDAIDVVNCAATFTLGHVMAEVGEPVGGQGTTIDESLAAMTPQTHPHLVSAFQSGYEYRPDEQYELGLSSMLDGFEARYGATKRSRRSR
jgi:AcrR family transcriptional regulator